MMQHEETSLLACQKKKTCFKWMKSYHCENELCLCLLDQHTDKQPHKTKQPLCQLSVSEPLCSSSQISWIKPQWVTVRERWRVEILKNALIVVRALGAVKTHSATRQQGSHTPPLAHHHNYAHMGEKERQNKILKKKKSHIDTYGSYWSGHEWQQSSHGYVWGHLFWRTRCLQSHPINPDHSGSESYQFEPLRAVVVCDETGIQNIIGLRLSQLQNLSHRAEIPL